MVRFFMCVICVLFFACSAGTVRAADPVEKCKVVFGNSAGQVTTSTLKSWGKTVDKNTVITLPTSNVNGYVSYWVVKRGTVTRKFAMGAKVKIVQDVTFRLTRYKIYEVKFYSSNGEGCYTALTRHLVKGVKFTLPSVTGSSTKRFLGWSTAKETHTPNYKAGTKITCTGNMSLYVSYQPIRTVYLYTCGGSLYKKVVYNVGSPATFPSVVSNEGMILGWSTQKNTHTNPMYYSGEDMPNYGTSFYMVEYQESSEKLLSGGQLLRSQKYQQVYVVGDSRSARSVPYVTPYVDNVHYIAKGGMGLRWLKEGDSGEESGIKQLLKAIATYSDKNNNKRNAVVFNLGANDLYRMESYVEYLNSIAQDLSEKYQCDLYFMSVNPVNDAMMKAYASIISSPASVRTESQVTNFNRNLRYRLDAKYYQYIDTCTCLRKYGWISYKNSAGIPDGLHYIGPTYQRIYNLMIQVLDR